MPGNGEVEALDLLARAGLPVPEGIVLSREAHRCFLESSRLVEDIKILGDRGEATCRQALRLRRKYRLHALEEDLGYSIRGALLDLGARTVVVRSEEKAEGGLGTIPSVFTAIRRAWLSTDGLKRQIEAASRNEEIPTWAVLVQREAEYETRVEPSPRG